MALPKNIADHKLLYGALGLCAAIGVVFIIKNKSQATSQVRYVTAAVAKGTITSAVSGTGQVAASDQVDIKPLTSGTYTSVSAKQGQQVKAGAIVATIDSQTALNQVNQAKAGVAQAQAAYEKLMAGDTANDIASQQLSIKSAQQALDKAKSDYQDTVVSQQQAVQKSYSALLNTGISAQQSDTLTTATITLTGSYGGTDEGSYNISLYEGGGGLYYSATGLGSQSGPVTRGLPQPLGNGLYMTFGSDGNLYPSTVWTVQIPNQQSGSYLTNLNSYNAALQTQKQSLDQAQAAINSAQNQLDQANLTLNTKLAPPTDSDIAAAKAQVESAQVNLANAQTAYSNTLVKAPFDGIIAKVSAQTGDQANPSTAIATEVTPQQIAQISLNEVDAAKIAVGQQATLTFSAIADLTLTGKVAEIDSIGTVTQNVVNFNVQIALDTQDARVKPGMSVAASVITAIKQDVLTVPSAAVKTNGGASYVETLSGGQPVQHMVTTGISSDTETEISGDIAEGDQVITKTIAATAAKPQAATNSLIPGLGGGARIGGGGGGAVFINAGGRAGN